MRSSSRREDDVAAIAPGVVRCPRCGRRVPAAGCPEHGPSARTDEESDLPDVDPEPSFPGYRDARVIGRGGFGTVYRAEPEVGGRAAAIKVARADRPDARERLVHEAEVLARVGPPHAPAVYGLGTLDGGIPYLAMEYIEAPPLGARLLPAAGPVAPGEACALVLAILRALEAVHARGYVHRDLKPENVFVDAAGRATLVDFGLVEPPDEDRSAPDLTQEGAVAGTAEYMSPEQCEGRDDIDARADVYAIGVILFELVSGRPPFWGPRAVVQEAHRSHRPPRLSAMSGDKPIPAALDAIVERCLAKDRRDRFPDARSLREAIEEAARAIAAASEAPAPSARRASEAPPRPAKDDRITVGLLFFEAVEDVASTQAHVTSLGGHLAHSGGGRSVAVFDPDRADNPARRALAAAEEMLRLGVAARVRIDLAAVAVRRRKDGSRRFLSPLFTREDRFPAPGDPPGVSLSPAAAAVLPDAAAGPAPAPSAEPAARPADPASWPLVGRDAIVADLVESARRAALDRVPTVASVVADAGHGKSHLFRVLLAQLHAIEGADVLDLRAREPTLGDADHALRELLRRGLELPDAAPPDGGHALLAERLGPGGGSELAPAVALALGWVSAEAGDPAMVAALRALAAAPGALRSALTVAAGEGLRRRAARRPLLLVLDDAQFGGDVLLSALEYAALAEAGAPLWICALGRPAFAEERPAWGERASRRASRRLGPLDPESAAALCRRLLLPAESVPDSAVARLVERAQAIPLHLVELVRGLKREGIVRKSPKGESWYLATDELDRLPDLPLIEWLARREIDALAPALGEHARLVALLGDQVTEADVAGVLRRLEEQGGGARLPLDARVGTRRLLEAGVVIESRGGHLGFRHALVREAVARGAPADLRRRIHLAAAAHYRSLAPGAAEERRLAQLARHASEAGMGDVAERAFLDLADRARARHAYTEAERLYSRALDQPAAEGSADRGAAFRGRGLMRYRIGRYHDALADFARALEAAKAAGDVATQIELLLDEATLLDWMDDYKRSEERVHEARALLADARSPILEARLLLGLGRSAQRFSRSEEAASLVEEAAALAEPLGEEGYESLVISLVFLGFILPGLGRLDDAQRVCARAIALCETHGDHLHLGAALNHRAIVWGYLGDKERMTADLERVLSLARELGQLTMELVGVFNLGEALLLMDDPDAAEPHIRRALALDRRLSGDPGRAVVALLEARLRLYRGDLEGACAIATRIRDLQRAPRPPGEADTLLVPSEDVMCAMVELSARSASPEEWDALEARAERFLFGPERIELIEMRGVAAARSGAKDDARRHFMRALDLSVQFPNALNTRLRRRLDELS